MTNKPLVLFHANCWDGFTAAWVAHKALKLSPPELVDVNYGCPPPDVEGRTVYILDFSYPRDTMKRMIRSANRVLCLDHHKTAVEALEGLPGCRFDMTKSGARLAWEHFFPGTKSPWIVDYTEDRDLWRHRLFHTRAINAWLRSHPYDLVLMDMIEHEQIEKYIPEGEAILRRERQIIDQHIKYAREVTIAGCKVNAVNATVLFSEIAGELADLQPFGVVWFERADGMRQYSLRSDEDGVDVSKIAKQFGGGGHRHSAGFECEGEPDEIITTDPDTR